jgi:hypothetical protein
VPPDLSDLVMKLLEKDPASRIATADEAFRALQAIDHDLALPIKDGAHGAASVRGRSSFHPGASAQRLSKPRALAPPRQSRLVLIAAAVAVLALVASGIVFYFPSGTGVVRLEINDPNIQVVFDKDGPTVKGIGERDVHVTPGAHGLHIRRGDLEFDTDKFLLTKGETVRLKIEWINDGKLQVMQGSKVIGEKSSSRPEIAGLVPDAAWLAEVAALSPERQVDAVAARLKERNPDFDGAVTHAIEGDVVTELQFRTDKVTDISPVRALIGLRTLACNGPHGKRSLLADLAPLHGMKLTSLSVRLAAVANLDPLQGMNLKVLDCDYTLVSDLTPLQGMPLAALSCVGTHVSELKPLKDMRLNTLSLNGTKVSDLTPLKDMSLTELYCGHTPVSSLAPLRGMPLTALHCPSTQVSDLTPLKGMNLNLLNATSTKVSSLSPLAGMKVGDLRFADTPVIDISPLEGMHISHIHGDFRSEQSLETLRSIKGLERINDLPAHEFWKRRKP